METDQHILKKPAKAALAALGVLLIGAIVFYKERLLFADTSFIVYSIINFKRLFIQNQRLGAVVTQIVPYLGQKFNLPIKTILFSYAISFNVFFFSVAVIVVYWFRQYRLAILMALYYFLIVSDSFFLANDEIHQAIAWMFLFLGSTLYLGHKKVNILLLRIPFLTLAFITVSTHFIAIITTVFLWVYLAVEKKNWPFSKSHTILLSCLLAAVILFKFRLAQSESYENVHLQGVLHPSLKYLAGTFSTPVVQMFFYRCLINYWIAIPILITGMVSLISSKQRLLAVWTVMSCIGYIMLMGLSYGDLDKNVLLFHIETEWESIGIIIAAPFVFSLLPRLKTSASIAILAIIFITRMCYIATAVPAFSWRISFQERVFTEMKRKNITKLALYMEPELMKSYILDWASPYETILSSAMNGDKPEITFFFVNKADTATQETLKDPKGFHDPYAMAPPKDLNNKYFGVDTLHPYRIMTTEELFK